MTWRSAAVAAALVAPLITPAVPGMANDRAVDWLMREPVTLFDLGILRMRQDLQQTADRLLAAGVIDGRPLTGAYYAWASQRIVLFLTLPDGAVPADGAVCRRIHEAAVRDLLRGTPPGPRQAERYLEGVFLHEGPGNLGRPRTLTDEVLAMVRFEVTLLPSAPVEAAAGTVRCGGRLDQEAAMIVSTPGG